jgi:hypothetical protein
MLFDLRGRRRRAVQATYLMLAVLMGGGLVFFGIGGDVSGGLFDAFSERGGGGGGNDAVEKRIDRAEKTLKTRPNDTRALKILVRDNYQLAAAQVPSGGFGFPEKAKDELSTAGRAWERYLKASNGKPDPSLAAVALQIFDVTALNKPKQAQAVATILADRQESAAAYIRVVQYATLAGDKRTADLAGKKAIDLAPRAEREVVEAQVKAAKATEKDVVTQ